MVEGVVVIVLEVGEGKRYGQIDNSGSISGVGWKRTKDRRVVREPLPLDAATPRWSSSWSSS